MLGKTFNIIIESYDKKTNTTYGRTMTNRIVGIKENLSNELGKEAKVKIIKITPGPLFGERIN
jgi:tRNA A37 methylthiotransferase MiaB